MNLVTWGTSPWGQPIILHAAWSLLRVFLGLGLAFALAHALWTRLRGHAPSAAVSAAAAARIPECIKRHSLAARLFHWIMAAAVLILLATAFLPKMGLRFAWVDVHVAAGVALLAAIVFHVVHAVCCMDFRAIWPIPADWVEVRDVMQGSGDNPPRAGKYPLGNKLYHLAIVVVGLAMAVTGLLMLWRVQNPLVSRDPYRFFDDTGWGVVYALHGLAGICLVALVIIHVYFALRPEKRSITRSMLTGSMDRDFFLAHHDPERWKVRMDSRTATDGEVAQ
ncbi:cytochrome b/b6 domain-containing protein [Desulfovibrio aminophilus]|uniref:cytochrome b/b6 domain-containing protein n=1 Tax=Desulfovibrio aminophilus TaxID=81425 RepID=UPI0033973AA7